MRKAFVREREPLKNVIGIVDLIDSDEFRSESRVPVLIKSSAKFPNRQRVFINVSRRDGEHEFTATKIFTLGRVSL